MSSERRRYFRINDTLGVAYRVLSEDEVQAQAGNSNSIVNVFSLLANYDTAINEQLADLKIKQPAVEKLLSAFNKKINCLVNHLDMESRLVERLAHKTRAVNISACGIAFVAEGELRVDQDLSLDIVLEPLEQHIFSYGKVVGCEPDTQRSGYYVRINFYGMSDSDHELLIQHIVQRQSTQLRRQREAK